MKMHSERMAAVFLAMATVVAVAGCGVGGGDGGGGGGFVPRGDGGATGGDGGTTRGGGSASMSDGSGGGLPDGIGGANEGDISNSGADGSGRGSSGGGGGGNKVCSPGATQLCHCTASKQGVQICDATGVSWQPCICDEKDAGGSGSSSGGEDGGTLEQDAGNVGEGCADRARQVYVVADDTTLLRFHPDQLKFETVGKLKCPQSGGGQPFSMSVDRQATAWVLYQSGSKGGGLFKVSTLDASCQSTGYTPGQAGFELFGMGFSADSSGSKSETLFIAGGSSNSWNSANGKLGSIAIPGLGVTYKGTIDVPGGSPELTGDGKGRLWGFFPQSSPPSVREIDKLTAKTGKTWNIPPGMMSYTQAWAFARWGGDFYLFFKSALDSSSAVFKLYGTIGTVNKVIPNTGHTIVGAGVSSCAPTGTTSAP